MTRLSLINRSRVPARSAYAPGVLVLAVLPVTVAYGSLAPLAVGGLTATATDGVVVLVIALALNARINVRAWLRAAPWPYRGLCVTLGGLIGLMALSSLWAIDRSLALKEVLKWSEALAIVLVAPCLITTQRDRRLILSVMGAVALSEALFGGAQSTLFAASLSASADRGIRAIGTFGQPNPYSGYLNLTLPIALALVFAARDVTHRWLSAAFAIVVISAQSLADSRGAWLGVASASVVMVWLLYPRWRRLALILGGGLAFVLGVLAPDRLTRALGLRPLTDAALSTTIDDANFSTVERLAHWAAGWRMLLAHPLTGVGAGNYPVAYHTYAVPLWQLPLGHAHNFYLNMAAELGIIGGLLSIAVFFMIFAVIGAVKGIGEQRLLAIGVAGVVAAIAAHSLVDDLTTHSMLIQLMLVIGCLDLRGESV